MKCVLCGCTEQIACIIEDAEPDVGIFDPLTCSWVEVNPLGNGPLCSVCEPEAIDVALRLGQLSMLDELVADLERLEALGLIERVGEDHRWRPTNLGVLVAS